MPSRKSVKKNGTRKKKASGKIKHCTTQCVQKISTALRKLPKLRMYNFMKNNLFGNRDLIVEALETKKIQKHPFFKKCVKTCVKGGKAPL
jgi:hypothetical protein